MRRLLIGLTLLLALAVEAKAEEHIQDFLGDVTVNTDASLNVRESITVNAEGATIRHGIFRDIPTIYTDRHGNRVHVDLDVTGVMRDGHAENYSIESLSNGLRIKIGNADTLIDPGSHNYTISYRTTRQLGFFQDYDELYWNVTGNGWPFAIDRAAVDVHLPAAAKIVQSAAYTGFQGTTGKDFSVLSNEGNEYRAETTRRLEPDEGFTIAVAWQKGIIAEPTSSQKWRWWIKDNAGVFAMLATLIASFLYYFYAWNKVGRDPPKGTIIPLFAPPEGLGPAGVRFVRREGFDDRCFASSLVGLAVKGRLRILDDDGTFTIEKTAGGKAPLTHSEQVLDQSITRGKLALKQSNHAAVSTARGALNSALAREFEGTLFLRNISWFVKGAILSVGGLVVSALLLPAGDSATGLFSVGFMGIWWGVILAVAWGSIKGMAGGRGFIGKIGPLFGLVFLVPFAGVGLLAPIGFLASAGSPFLYILIVAAVLLVITNIVFYYLLRAPTVQGRKTLDQIEGFRMYMSTAEEERLKILNPPEKTPELFERYLPYALALDCENEWNSKFAAVLAAAAAAGASAPLWYSGSNWDWGRSGSFTDSLGSSLASSVASASTAPGSSSGSGGGGSSGGGGGGGGGGGW